MMSVNERLARLRRNYGRLVVLLDVPDRGPLVMAEITHAAAHLAEHAQALDEHLTAGFSLPEAWLPEPEPHHHRSEETAPTA